MPPKNNNNGKKAAAVAKHQHTDDDDALLDQIINDNAKAAAQQKKKKHVDPTTASANAAAKQSGPMTNEERKARHRERLEAIDKAKSADMERMFESELKRKLAMEKIQELMRGGGNFGSPWLNKPKTDITVEELAPANGMATCTGSLQGWRQAMEDAHVTNMAFSPKPSKTSGSWGLFAVFDGHAGAGVSKRCRLVLPALVQSSIDDASVEKSAEEVAGIDFEKGLTAQQASVGNDVAHLLAPIVPKHFMHEAYLHLDESLRKNHDGSGSTAVTVIRTDTAYVCANVGDSRALLVREGASPSQIEVIDLSVDHKPEDAEEKDRIYAANGTVENNRVNGGLAMSRAIGDFSYKENKELTAEKQQVSPLPDIRGVRRTAGKDRFLIVGCDGVFDVFSNVELAKLVNTCLYKDGKSLSETVKHVCAACVAPEHPDGGRPAFAAGTDNVTLTIVKFE